MIKKRSGFGSTLFAHEVVLHDQHNIHVVGIRLVRDVTTENNQTVQSSGSTRQMEYSSQSIRNGNSLNRFAAEPGDNLIHCGGMDSFRQVAGGFSLRMDFPRRVYKTTL